MIEHVYIHIPFCIRKCHYCSFVSGFDVNQKTLYINSLLAEIKKKYNNDKLKTIYFGGGTPSLLSADELNSILSCFNFDKNTEITLEANPETLDLEKFSMLRNYGFNRVSLGIQTFDDNILKLIGRNHNEEKIQLAVETIKNSGFKNISIDLIYGLPNQTINLWKKDLEKAIQLDIQHISSYGLKIEENSTFGKKPPENIPDDEMQAEMYSFLCTFLKENNFNHYEISNFAKTTFESKHNSSYWENKNYYGFGLNASGYEGNIRYKNTSNWNEYITNPLQKAEEEILTQQETLENEIFLALRLTRGINIKEINSKYNINFEEKYKKILEKYTKLSLLRIEKNYCALTEDGFLLSNNIMSEFID